MSRLESDNGRIDSAISLARKSKSLIPRINNWCRNIKIDSEYGGMIGEMGFPTMNYISCSQAEGDGAMDLEWIATDFIIDNCQGCKFHEELYNKNFGRDVIDTYLQRLETANAIINKKEQALKTFNDKIIELVRSGEAKNTEVSIYRLLQKLNDDEVSFEAVKHIFEATNVSADFFTLEAVEYISLFLDKEISPLIASSIVTIIKHDRVKFSNFVKEKVLEAIANGTEVETLVEIVPCDLLVLEKMEELLENIIHWYFDYQSGYGRENPFDDHSPNIILFIDNFRKWNLDSFEKVIKKCLSSKSKSVRINTVVILDKLFSIDNSIIKNFILELIDAWDVKEDSYGLSADVIIRTTLIRTVDTDAETLFKHLDSKFSKAKLGTKLEIIEFYREFINNQDFEINKSDYISVVFDKLVSTIHENFTNNAHKSTSRILDTFSRKNPEFVKDKFNLFFAVLLKAIEKRSTFIWYRNNLNENTVTFNPLEGKDYMTIDLLENLLQHKIDDIGHIISNIITVTDDIFDILKIIDSIYITRDSDEVLKTTLIRSLVAAAKKRKIFLANSLPYVYNWLIDLSSVKVRIEAIKFIKEMIDIYPESVPQTIYDLLSVLIKDNDLLIKKYAIDAYGEVIRSSFEKINIDAVKYLLEQLDNSFVIFHKAIVNFVYQIAEQLSSNERLELLTKLIKLLTVYSHQSEIDIDFCKTLCSKILYLSKEFNPNHNVTKVVIIEKFILPNCYLHDFYDAKSYIDMLNDLKKEDSKINGYWLKASWAFLYRYRPQKLDFMSFMNYRKELYLEMLNLDSVSINSEYECIKEDLKQAITYNVEDFGHDIIFTINVLNYFCLHEQIIELCLFINDNVPRVPILKSLFKVIDVSNDVSRNELKFN